MKLFHIFLGIFLAIWAMINYLSTGSLLWIMIAGISLSISYSQFKKYR